MPESTYHLPDWKSVTTESQNDSDTVKSSKLKKCAIKTQPLPASTPFVHNSVSHVHIVVPFMTFWQFQLTPIAVMNRIFHSEMAVTVRAGGACTQFKTKHHSKHQRVLPVYGPP